jgi:predicted alpha/beta superfamily hydrolase
MKLKYLYLSLFLLAPSGPANAVETEFLQGLGVTRYHHVESESVGRAYHVFVSLPAGYDGKEQKTYPTIYVLDGGRLFPLVASYGSYLNLSDEAPDSIIVGISYGTEDWREGNLRSTDYTAPAKERAHYGGADKFQRFLKTELIPFIEETYRSRSDRRIVFGQSIGGQFVLYTAQTDPGLFWGHIASNPALHRNVQFYLDLEPVMSGKSFLFVANGSLNDRRFQEPIQQWIEHWKNAPDKPWTLETVVLQGHTHLSAAPASFRRGMHWLFELD